MALVWAALRLREYLGTEERYKTYSFTDIMESVHSTARSSVPKYEFGLGDLLVAVIIAAATILYLVYQERLRREEIRRRAFPFMKLPAEIRAEVFAYLVEPPEQPVLESLSLRVIRSKVATIFFAVYDETARILKALNGRHSRRFSKLAVWEGGRFQTKVEAYRHRLKLQRHPVCKHLNAMRLVSRNFGEEFLTTYRIHANPEFTLEAVSSSGEQMFGVWQNALGSLKNCTLRLIARPGIANAFDPRQANLREWLLRDSIFNSMRQMTTLKSMTLGIEACGNPLWNPLWLWYLTGQAFMESDVKALNRIEFTMKNWDLQPSNYLKRLEGGETGWEWRCIKEDHFVTEDEKDMPIRPFCARLYLPCRVCEPEDSQ